jgi:hypothetical protein
MGKSFRDNLNGNFKDYRKSKNKKLKKKFKSKSNQFQQDLNQSNSNDYIDSFE